MPYNHRSNTISRITADDFEGLLDAMLAKKSLMLKWAAEGVNYGMAVVRYAAEQKVSLNHAQERVDDMEILTGVKLERAGR